MYGRDDGSGRYGRGGGGRTEDIRQFFLRGGTPVTLGLIIANVITFFLLASGVGASLVRLLAFSSGEWPRLFWTPVTWPLVGAGDPISLLFSLGWFYTFGSSLERSWGARVYGLFVVAMAVITALGVWIGGLIPGVGGAVIAGLWTLGGVLTVAWALTNRSETINFWGLPLPPPALILLGCAIVWYDAGARLIGLFALAGCAAAWWYVTQGRSSSYLDGGWGSGRRRSAAPPNLRFRDFGSETRETVDGSPARRGWSPARWWRERQERRRLEAMFRRSGYTDPEERNRRR